MTNPMGAAPPKVTTNAGARWRTRHVLILVVALTIAVTLGWLTRDPDVGIGGDEATYLALSHSIAHGRYHDEFLIDTPPHGKYPPGNPLWIAAVRGLAGPNLEAVRVANLLLVVITAILLGDALRRLLGPWFGVAGASLAALSPSVLATGGSALSEAPFSFLSVLALWCTLRDESTDQPRWGQLACLSAIASFLTRTIGLTLLIAIGLWAIRRRRWRLLGAHAMVGMAVVAGWFTYTSRVASTTAGSTYVEDLRHIGAPSAAQPAGPVMGLLAQATANLQDYVGILPWALGIPTSRRFGLPIAAGLAVIGLCAVGLWSLAGQWPALTAYGALYGGALLLWPWFDSRLLQPLVPALLAAMVFGGMTLARGRVRVVRGIIIAGLALAPIVTGMTTIVRHRPRLICNRADPFADDNCYTAERRAFVAAARSIGRTAPANAIVATTEPATVFHYSGRQTLPLVALLKREQMTGVLNLHESRVDLLLLSQGMPDEVGPATQTLTQHCAQLEIRAAVAPGTLVLAARDSSRHGETACEALARASRPHVEPRGPESR